MEEFSGTSAISDENSELIFDDGMFSIGSERRRNWIRAAKFVMCWIWRRYVCHFCN
jgi:hypothetical protein